MRSRKITKTPNRKPQIRREREPISWKYILLTSFCGLLLVVGFFGAARQHFASINYGIENSKLKKQIEELKSEQVRLKLAREVALSPAEIKKSAKKMGFTEMTASNIQAFHVEKISDTNSNANKLIVPDVPKVDLKLDVKKDKKKEIAKKAENTAKVKEETRKK
jgi:nitrogen regulatory protein PII